MLRPISLLLSTALILTGMTSSTDAQERDQINEFLTGAFEDTVAKGQIYLGPKEFVSYHYADFMMDLFWGDFRRRNSRQPIVSTAFTAFVATYSRACSAHLPSEVAVYTWTNRTIIRNGWGTVLSNSSNVKDRIFIKPEFQPIYNEYLDKNSTESQGEYIKFLLSNSGDLSLHGVGARVSLTLNVAQDIKQFFDRYECASGEVLQFEKNLLRVASDLGSIQDTGNSINGVGGASNIEDVLVPTTFGQLCVASRDYDLDSFKYCGCVERYTLPSQQASDYEETGRIWVESGGKLKHVRAPFQSFTSQYKKSINTALQECRT